MSRLLFCLIILFILCSPGFQHVSAEGQISITNIMVNQPLPTVQVTAGYLVLKNNTDRETELISVSSPVFERIELHQSVIEDGMARMLKLETVNIPARSELEFSPGGYHLMLFNPAGKLDAGSSVSVIFSFSDGTEITADGTVMRPGMHNSADQHDHHE